MKKLLVVLVLSISISSIAQGKKAIKNASGDLIGITTRADFDQQPYANWFKRYSDSYTIDQKVAKKLKKALKEVTIKAFMGTWCGDSKRETPKFYKVLEAADFDLKNLEMITVNRGKRTPDHLEKGFKIRRVPTFIFFKGGKEIGRYVEFARESLEKDMLKIVTGKAYKHSYDHSK